jgi:hypothetical protein
MGVALASRTPHVQLGNRTLDRRSGWIAPRQRGHTIAPPNELIAPWICSHLNISAVLGRLAFAARGTEPQMPAAVRGPGPSGEVLHQDRRRPSTVNA